MIFRVFSQRNYVLQKVSGVLFKFEVVYACMKAKKLVEIHK